MSHSNFTPKSNTQSVIRREIFLFTDVFHLISHSLSYSPKTNGQKNNFRFAKLAEYILNIRAAGISVNGSTKYWLKRGEMHARPLRFILVNTCKPHTIFHYLFIYFIHYIKYKLFWWRWTLCKLRWAVCCFCIHFYQLTTVTENFYKALVKAKPCDLQSWHAVSKATPSLHGLFQLHILFWHEKRSTDDNWMWTQIESIRHTNLSTY